MIKKTAGFTGVVLVIVLVIAVIGAIIAAALAGKGNRGSSFAGAAQEARDIIKDTTDAFRDLFKDPVRKK